MGGSTRFSCRGAPTHLPESPTTVEKTSWAASSPNKGMQMRLKMNNSINYSVDKLTKAMISHLGSESPLPFWNLLHVQSDLLSLE